MNQNEKSHIALDSLKRVEGRHPNLWSVADDLQQALSVGRHLEGSVFSLAEAALLSHKLQRGEGPHYLRHCWARWWPGARPRGSIASTQSCTSH